MIILEKDGCRMSVGTEIQASAFLLSGWTRVEDIEKPKTPVEAESKPKVGRPAKK